MWRSFKPKNPKSNKNKNIVYYVYDISTTMSDFCASFAVRKHAENWGKLMFGNNSYVSDRRLHKDGYIWNGQVAQVRDGVFDGNFYYCETHGHEQTVPCPDCKGT